MKKLFFPALILCVLLVALFLLLSRPEQKSLDKQTHTQATKTILADLQKSLGIQGDIQEYNYADWMDENGDVLPMQGEQFFVGSTNMKDNAKYASVPFDSLMSINAASLTPLLTPTQAFFTDNGFSKNVKNTRVINTDGSIADFYGFEKGNTKCLVRINEQSDPFGYYVCGKIDSEQVEKQKPFIPVFKETDYNGDKIVSFRVNKVENDYAMGTANGMLTGFTWMANNTNGTWKVLWKGNEIPLCTDMQKLAIPQSLYGNCYTAQEANGM